MICFAITPLIMVLIVSAQDFNNIPLKKVYIEKIQKKTINFTVIQSHDRLTDDYSFGSFDYELIEVNINKKRVKLIYLGATSDIVEKENYREISYYFPKMFLAGNDLNSKLSAEKIIRKSFKINSHEQVIIPQHQQYIEQHGIIDRMEK